jgi:hypothetical protein
MPVVGRGDEQAVEGLRDRTSDLESGAIGHECQSMVAALRVK